VADLEYSLDAINVLNRFYRCEVLVYVEGDDDVPFWRTVFAAFYGETIAVESVGSSPDVDKYIARIVEEDAKLVVARDKDYLAITGQVVKHDRVVYTYGHSIENSLYVPGVIEKVAQVCHRKNAPKKGAVGSWMVRLCEVLRPVVIFDIANELGGFGISVLGLNCARFMKSARSSIIDPARVDAWIKEVGSRITERYRKAAEDAIVRGGGYDRRLVRGHVLASAVLRFVSTHAARNVAYETLYASAVSVFAREIEHDHPHRDYYRGVVERAAVSARL
jgi:hypothetical protein